MGHTPADSDEIERLIRKDVDHLAEHAGLKDPRFGSTLLVQEKILPGDHVQQAALYKKLILNNIDNVEPKKCREALYVKLNLREGYPDTGSEARLGLLGRSWGLKVHDYGDEKGRSKQAQNIARQGRNQLATLIRKEIDEHNERDDWDVRQEEPKRGSGVAKPPSVVAEDRQRQPAPDRSEPIISFNYVQRNKLAARFRELVTSGSKLIVFHGLPGVGKTWLAQTLAIQAHPQHMEAPIVRPTSAQFDTSLKVTLTGRDQDQDLTKLVYGDQAPPFMIIDGLESADELHGLLRGSPRNVVLVTCRDKGKSPPELCEFVKVGQMEPTEAKAMVRKRLPSLSESDVGLLADAVYCYPLILRYACALIANQHIPIAQFCKDIEQDFSILTRQVQADGDALLSALLLNIMSVVGKIDPLALRLLPAIAECYPETADWNVLWRFAHIGWGQSSISPTRFAQAIETLQRFSLIDSVDDDEGLHVSLVNMHGMTRRLLKEAMGLDKRVAVAQGFSLVSESYRDGDFLDYGSAEPRPRSQTQGILAIMNAMLMCAPIIIDNTPVGAAEHIGVGHRNLVEVILARNIYMMESLFRELGPDRGFVPQRWVDWTWHRPEILHIEQT